SNPITIIITKKDNATTSLPFSVNFTSNSNYIMFKDLHNNTIRGCGPYVIDVLNQSEFCQFEIYALPGLQGGNYTVYTATAKVFYNGTVDKNTQGMNNPFNWKVTVMSK
ncbi:MAG: hypothetical protein ACHQX1_02710, partial [Candidatus Micrarchaeales archaeon]